MKKYDVQSKLQTERELKERGYRYICGVDEVGRGPLAGPVVCAAVIMPTDNLSDIIEGVDDSKKLSLKRRLYLSDMIAERAIACNICRIEPQLIDQINILQATRTGMKEAIEGLKVQPDFVITDGNMTLDIAIPQRSIVKGDALCYSIGAASIAAKVYRDTLMQEYAAEYPQYGFDRNVGYGTAEHIAAIQKFGLCPIHRRSFTHKWQ